MENEDFNVFRAPFLLSDTLLSVAMSNLSLNPTIVADAPYVRAGHRANQVSVTTPVSDGNLLRRFLKNRNEAVFAELVDRFGPLVYGIALRMLRNHHAAEDAFQATFMIFARDAKKIRSPDSVSSGLQGTAMRVAKTALKRRLREESLKEPTKVVDEKLYTDINEQFQQRLLDEELARLPEIYRAPLVLHFLEGKTYKETALALGTTVGAVRGRLQRGKRELRLRLLRRGVEFSVVVASMALWQSIAQASIQTSLSTSTIAGGMATLQGTPYPWACSPEAVKISSQNIAMLTNGKVLSTSVLLLSTIATGWLSSGLVVSEEKVDSREVRTEIVVSEIETNVALQKTEEESATEAQKLFAFADDKREEPAESPEENPDGRIVRVDSVTRRVWINFGSKHNLRTQVTFSVYSKGQVDIGKNKYDIKAKIEVTKITNKHLAECRIIQEVLERPIQEGDLIYSPLFTPGQIEFFSFVGALDLDGDGMSDRKLLHDIIENAEAKIEVEIDDQGNRIPKKGEMTKKTKFLVVGDIPKLNLFANNPKREAEIQKVFDEKISLEREALRNGIRIITLRDFLNYIGYENKQRLYIEKPERPFNLKSGSRSRRNPE